MWRPLRCSLCWTSSNASACSPAQGLSEKGIDNLRADLAKTDAECEEEIRRAVYDNYQHFIGVTQARIALRAAAVILLKASIRPNAWHLRWDCLGCKHCGEITSDVLAH